MRRHIFVFGSNLAGRHGAGAARCAADSHGATWGVGVGPSGHSYAIPTKDAALATLPISEISKYVNEFNRYAAGHPGLQFRVTAIGCGLAGYTPADIAPLFADSPPNCLMPAAFRPHLGESRRYWRYAVVRR